jgi:hypothetical protein
MVLSACADGLPACADDLSACAGELGNGVDQVAQFFLDESRAGLEQFYAIEEATVEETRWGKR